MSATGAHGRGDSVGEVDRREAVAGGTTDDPADWINDILKRANRERPKGDLQEQCGMGVIPPKAL